MKTQRLTETELAKKLGISRSSLYYKHKMSARDEEIKKQIESVLTDHFDYGHKRIALELKLNKKRILRVMKKNGIKPSKRRVKRFKKVKDINQPATNIPNIFKTLSPIKPDVIWVSDFTYIKYKQKFIYLTTLIDDVTKINEFKALLKLNQLNIGKLLINKMKDLPFRKMGACQSVR